ncbi:transmembrane protein [Rhynchospora pubera]|uniref:Transmembrane protein n=1 Tax=Rhynchospora pubera TaxID=906938 RepID=A0AAV8G5T6_9POAL|nr:transmembrane protein [Rhynchospora pubera]
MADKGAEEGKVAPAEPAVVGLVDRLQEQWHKTKEHAETYPYVWGSYILVYSGLGAYLTWRWRKLRRTEDRVRALQERLKKLVEADEAKKPPSGL